MIPLTGDTPLFIASKFNNLEMVQILLANDDCKKLVKNLENLNEFDIAFLKGNYNICYYLMYEYKNKIKENINEDNDNNINNDIYNEPKEKIDEVVIINKSKGKSNTTCLFFSNVYVIKHLRQNVLRLPQSVKRLRI